MNRKKSKDRHKARELTLQAIYQWQFTQDSITEIELQFRENNDMSKVDGDYFSELLHQVPENVDQIDKNIRKAIDRPFADLNPVELAVLRIAIYEFIFKQDIPYRVIINEALEITKTFGSTDGFKYVNAVLDALAKDLRTVETLCYKKAK
jgi:transcription antitermination protein NusB